MNSTLGAVGPIFNEKIVEKCNLWVRKQYTNALFTVEKSISAASKKKKKSLKRVEGKRGRKISRIRTPPNTQRVVLGFFFGLQVREEG